MSCEATRDKLYDLVFGLLDDEKRGRVESHLKGCADCRKAHMRVLRERDLLGRWSVPPAPRGLAQRTIAALHAAAKRKETPAMDYKPVEPEMRWLGSRRFWLRAAAAMLLVIAAVAAYSASVATRHARPQEAFVYGQWAVTPGQPAAFRVFVRNGVTRGAVEDGRVAVRLVSPEGDSVWKDRAATDSRGIAQVAPDLPADLPEGDYTLKVIVTSGEGRSEISRQVALKRSFRVMVTTDKPLYQPGQLMHIRALSLFTADLAPVGGRNIVIEVQDAKGNKVFKKKAATSEYGIASADFELADQVNMGSYTVSATIGDTASERAVTVKRYTLPKFKVELASDRGFYMPGAALKGDLSARYTFGEPVSGGRVRVVASEFVERLRPFADVEGETDAEGRFEFEIQLKEHFVGQELKKGDAFVTLEATVTDTADHTQKKTLDLTVTANPIRIELLPESGTLVQNVPNALYIVTAYPDGRPAKTKLTIGATGKVVETSEVGIAKVEITPEQRDLQLTVAAEDETGLRAQVTRRLRVSERLDAFLLRTDRAVYRAGETVHLTVLSATRTARVFLDAVKDRRTTLMKAIDVRDGRGDLALDLPPDLFGTLELHAYRILADGNIISDTKLVQVNRADELKITMELDKETYRPAEKALLKFVVERGGGGGPVQAALGLAGVDEAVFALSEMQPGLLRVYFTLQEEILKPRYEIHARLPVAVSETVVPETEPAPPELEEASVVLFSGAEGSGPPAREMSATFQQKQETFERDKEHYFRGLVAVGVFVPFGLYVLFVLPIIIYAGTKLFWRKPIEGASEEDLGRLRRAMARVTGWWILGFSLPFAAFKATAVVGSTFRLHDEEVWGAMGAGVVALIAAVMLIISVVRLRRAPASRAVPLLRKFATLLAPGYVLAAGALVTIVAAEESGLPAIDFDAVLQLFAVIVGAALLVIPAMCIAGTCGLRRIGAGRLLLRTVGQGSVLAFLVLLVIVASLTFSGQRASNTMMTVSNVLGEPPANGGSFGGAGWDDKDTFGMPGDIAIMEAESYAAPGAPHDVALKAPTRIRRYFPETLLWRPELITDASGRAQLEVPLADSITTWRIAMNAVSKRGELGAATQGLRVFQDFFVDIDFPVALTQHDLVSVPVAVYNYLDVEQTVRLEAQAGEWCELLDEPVQTLKIGPREVTSVHLRLRAVAPGHHSLTLKAFGSEMADAVERRVIVEPDGKAFVQTINGRLGENMVREIEIPEGAIEGASDLLVKIYPGAFSQVVEGLDSIFRMPYGCFEQTSSVTYPNLLVLDYMRRTGQVKPDIEMKALNFINLGYQRLLSFEVKGGGFSLYGKRPADAPLTAYGLMEFSDMAKVHEVDPAVIERTREWLYSQQGSDGSWRLARRRGDRLAATAYTAWALAESGQADARLNRALDYVAANAAGTDDQYTLALCANALATADRSEAGAVLARLESMKQVEDGLVHWSSTAEGVTFSRGNVLEIETTALAAYAMLKARRHTDTAHKALAWLIEQKDSRGTWHSTQATVHAMRALLAGTGPSGGVEGETHVSVSANGTLARELTITPETSDVFHLISLRHLVRAGSNSVSLETAGKGNLAYQIVATHYMPWPKEEAPAEKEMSIDLDYDTTTLATDDTLSCEVTIRYNGAGSANMTIVDLGVPPGFEVIADGFESLKERGVIQRYSMTGRQVILYFEQIRGGEPVTFTYGMRAKFPVKVKTPPSSVYQYYEPAMRDEAAPVELTVL